MHNMMNSASEKLLHGHGGLDHRRMQRLLGYNLTRACIPTDEIYDLHIGGPFELRKAEFTMLALTESNTRVSPKRMSQALGVAAPNLTVTLDRLEARGLLTRKRSEEDRRSMELLVTPKGKALLKKADMVAEKMEQDLLGNFSAAEIAILIELLQKVAFHRKAMKSTRSIRPVVVSISR